MTSANIKLEALPQDLAAYTREVRETPQAKFCTRRPYPFFLYVRSNLWDRSLLLAAASGGGSETKVVRYDIVAKGLSFVSPVRSLQNRGDAKITLGRGTDNDIVVPVPSVSSRHAYLQPPAAADGQWTITDLGSTNGTFLTENRLAPQTATQVPDGEYLRLGGNLIAWFMSPQRLWDTLQDDAKIAELIDL